MLTRILIVLLGLLLLIHVGTVRNWETASALKPLESPTILVQGTGVMKWNPRIPYHIIIGYDAENVEIQGPPNDNVIANGSFVGNPFFRGNVLVSLGTRLEQRRPH
jgi:hypothetical protein